MQASGRPPIEVNTYNLNNGKFGYRGDEDDLNGAGTTDINGELRLNRNYINEVEEDEQNEPIQINNPIYYQQPPPQQQLRALPPQQPPQPLPLPPSQQQQQLDDSVFLQQEENRMANKKLYGQEEEDEQNQNESVLRNNQPKQELYFNTRIRNTGYWGKVKLRRGTWMVIIGLFFMCISLTIISVFWTFWYHPAVNIPCRVLGVCLLVWSTSSVVFGLTSNWFMISEPTSRFFVGSPRVRWTFWLMLGSFIMITIASILITIYYTYWHNRFVNTPMIIIAIHFFFFGGLAFIFAFIYNIKLTLLDIKVAKYGPEVLESSSSEEEDDFDVNAALKQQQKLYMQQQEQEQAKIDELYAAKSGQPLTAATAADESEQKRDFRKKVQMKPRTLMSTSSAYQNSANYSPNQSFNKN